MLIDWDKVRAAYKRGEEREAQQWAAIKGAELNEGRIRDDLERLERMVTTCHDDTLRVIEANLDAGQTADGWPKPVLSAGELALAIRGARECMRKPNDGQPAPWRHIYAIEVLHPYYEGRKPKSPQHPSKGESKFIIWLGEQLVQLEPELDDPNEPEKADRAAWNAWRALHSLA